MVYKDTSPFTSVYRKKYNTQHVILRHLEEWRENLGKTYDNAMVLMDLYKAFDCVPHDLLLAKRAVVV